MCILKILLYLETEKIPLRPVLVHIEYGENRRIRTLKVLVYSEQRCQK